MIETGAVIFDLDDERFGFPASGHFEHSPIVVTVLDGIGQTLTDCYLDVGEHLTCEAAALRKFNDVPSRPADRFA